MNKHRKTWMMCGVVALASIGSCKPAGKTGEQEAGAKNRIHAVGYLEPRDKLRRLSFQSYGVIAQVNEKIGEVVKAGDVIARLDDSVERSALGAAQAKLAVAEANRKLVLAGAHPDEIAALEAAFRSAGENEKYRIKERNRWDNLEDKRAISGTDRDAADFQAAFGTLQARQAEAAWNKAKHQVRDEDRQYLDASVKSANAEVEAAKVAVEQKILRAPVDGKVVEILLRQGEAVTVTLYEPVVLFAPSGNVDVRAEVDQNAIKELRPGLAAQVRMNGSKSWMGGKVRSIKPIMGRKSVFSRQSTERMDIQIIEVWIETDEPLAMPLGAEVDVEITP